MTPSTLDHVRTNESSSTSSTQSTRKNNSSRSTITKKWNAEAQRFKHFLQGLQTQAIYLGSLAQDAFNGHLEIQSTVSEKLNTLKNVITIEANDIPSKPENKYLDLLGRIALLCTQKTKEITGNKERTKKQKSNIYDEILLFFYNLLGKSQETQKLYRDHVTSSETYENLHSKIRWDPSSKNTLANKNLTDIQKVEYFNEILDLFSPFFEKGLFKLNKINEKINSCNPETDESEITITNVIKDYACRINDIIPEALFIDELKSSLDKDIEKLKNYVNFKNIWSESLIAYQTLIANYTLMIVDNYSEILKNQKIYFDDLKKHFEEIKVSELSKGYVETFDKGKEKYSEKKAGKNGKEETFYKRDLKEKFRLIESYKTKMEVFKNQHQTILDLNGSVKDFFPKIKIILDKMTWSINSLNEQLSINHNFDDESTKEETKEKPASLIQEKIKGLSHKQLEVQQKWNELFLELNKTNREIDVLNNFSEFNQNAANCYLRAEKIQGEIRHARRKEKNEHEHKKDYFMKQHEFELLENLCTELKLTFLKSEKILLKSFCLCPEKLEASLQDPTIEFDHSNIGIVCISEGDESTNYKPFYDQQLSLKDEFSLFKENMTKSRATLTAIHKLAFNEMNREKKAQNGADAALLDYQDHFTSIYEYENTFMQKLQKAGEGFGKLCLMVAGYDLPEKKKFIPLNSSVDK